MYQQRVQQPLIYVLLPVLLIVRAVPEGMIAFTFRDTHFSFVRTWALVRTRKFWRREVPQSIIACWMVWLPAVTLIYCLPGSLQIPLFVLVSCFWSLIFQLMAGS